MNRPLIINAQREDLGGFFVHRAIPGADLRYVGPFVFFDHMGPLLNGPGQVIEVRPHPHIGLATVTYLFEGRVTHRDNLGNVQIITPGDLNWMTAGRGVVHSERTPKEDRDPVDGKTSHGIQIWVGLPKNLEECEADFSHWDKEQLPLLHPAPGLEAKLLLGQCWGAASPVKIYSPTICMDLVSKDETEFDFPSIEKEMGFYLVSGTIAVNGEEIMPHQMAIFDDAEKIRIKMSNRSRAIVIGGEPFPEPRSIWWNFVSSNPSLIKKASQKWLEQTMAKIPGETEYTPLPDDDDA